MTHTQNLFEINVIDQKKISEHTYSGFQGIYLNNVRQKRYARITTGLFYFLVFIVMSIIAYYLGVYLTKDANNDGFSHLVLSSGLIVIAFMILILEVSELANKKDAACVIKFIGKYAQKILPRIYQETIENINQLLPYNDDKILQFKGSEAHIVRIVETSYRNYALYSKVLCEYHGTPIFLNLYLHPKNNTDAILVLKHTDFEPISLTEAAKYLKYQPELYKRYFNANIPTEFEVTEPII